MRAVLFDYEGTLGVNSILWNKIYSGLDLDSQKSRDIYLKFKEDSNGYGYEEFTEDRLDMLNSADILQERDADQLLEEIYQEHFEENGLRDKSSWTVDFFDEIGFDTYLISHAPDSYSRKAHHKLGTDLHVDTEDIIADGIFEEIRRTENYKKEEVVENLQNSYDEVWFVGNGKNDFKAAEIANKGFIIDNIDDINYQQTEAPKMSFYQILNNLPDYFKEVSV